jgi:tape measure domain-containing protein
MAIAKLVVEANADLKNLYRELDKGTAAVQRFAAGVKSAGAALSIGITLPLVGLGVAVGSAAADMDSLRRGLVAVAGSSKGAEEQLKRLEDVARLPGLGFREAIQGSIRLQAVGINVGVAERALRAFGNAVAFTGGGKAELDRITVQLGQLASKGKVLSQDLRPIIDAAPAVGQALRQAFGTVSAEDIEKLGLSSSQFLDRLLTALERLPTVSGGVKNSFENLTDSLFRAKVAIGEQLIPVIVPLVDSLTRALEGARSLNPETVRWALAIGSVVAVAGPLLFLVGQLTTAVVALTAALGVAGLAGTIATGGVLLLLGGLSALFVKNKLDALSAAAAADTYRASLIGLSRGQLLSNLNREMLNLMTTQASEQALMASGRGFQRGVQPEGIADAFRRGGVVAALNPRAVPFVRETHDLHALGVEANNTAARIASLKKALDLLDNSSTAPTPPAVPPGGADKFRGLIDTLTDRLRELAVLQRFNVPSLNLLPDNMQEQVRLVDQLGNELDTLQDGLKRFQQAGRTPPPQLTWGIDVLRAQLRDARVELKALAQDFQMKARIGLLPTSPLGGGPSRNVGQIVSAVGELPARDANRLATSGINQVSERLSLLGVALGGFHEALTQSGRALKELGKSQLRNAISGVEAMAAQFTPAGLAAYALSQAMEALRPVLEAVLLPVKIFGEIIAIGVTPVLRLLFPILKALAIVLSFVQEAFDRVIGTLLKGIGWFVRAIGKVINFLDPFGNPGNGLVKLGNSLRGSADSFFDAADEIKKKRKELQGLDFNDALNKTTENLNRLSESVINAVQGFKIAKYRFEATAPMNVPTESVRSGSAQSAPVWAPRIGEIHLHAAPGEDVAELWRRLKGEIRREATYTLGLRSFAAQLG